MENSKFNQLSTYFENLKLFTMEIIKYKEYKEYILPALLSLLPILITFLVHHFCNYFYCDEWYSVLGLNIICNGCIDIKKAFKDYLIKLYIGYGTYLLTKIDNLIISVVNKLNVYK